MGKKKINWDTVMGDYVTGLYSLREISRRNNCSNYSVQHKVKSEGWDIPGVRLMIEAREAEQAWLAMSFPGLI